jgi:hypothetical protein
MLVSEGVATSEPCVQLRAVCVSTGLLYLCALLDVVTVGRQSIWLVCDEGLTREKPSGR